MRSSAAFHPANASTTMSSVAWRYAVYACRPLAVSVDDGGAPVGGIRRPLHVAALAEARDLAADQRRFEVGEVGRGARAAPGPTRAAPR